MLMHDIVGVGTPAIIDCPVIDPLVPVVDAGPDITVVSGQNVLLSGSIMNRVDGTLFLWMTLMCISNDGV